MPRPHIQSFAFVLVLLCANSVYAAQPSHTVSPNSVMRSLPITISAAPLVHAEAATLNWTLPPEDKPKTRWPWWLRILAVIGVLVFIRLVAGTIRNKPSGPGPV